MTALEIKEQLQEDIITILEDRIDDATLDLLCSRVVELMNKLKENDHDN